MSSKNITKQMTLLMTVCNSWCVAKRALGIVLSIVRDYLCTLRTCGMPLAHHNAHDLIYSREYFSCICFQDPLLTRIKHFYVQSYSIVNIDPCVCYELGIWVGELSRGKKYFAMEGIWGRNTWAASQSSTLPLPNERCRPFMKCTIKPLNGISRLLNSG